MAEVRAVRAVARLGSFSAAAAELGYTQSGVSRLVAAAEAAAGTALFVRGPRGARPTAAGAVVARRGERLVAEMDGLALELAGLRDRLAGRLVVGAFPTAAASLPRAMARLADQHPDLRVVLLEGSSPAQLRQLRAGRVEVVVVATGDGLPDHDLRGLRSQRLELGQGGGVAVGSGHRLADRDALVVADLVEEIWVIGAGEPGEPQFGAWPTLARPRIGYRVRSWPTRLGLVSAGLAVAVVPRLAADMLPAGVRWLPVRDEAASGRAVLAVTADDPSPAASVMTDALHHVAAH